MRPLVRPMECKELSSDVDNVKTQRYIEETFLSIFIIQICKAESYNYWLTKCIKNKQSGSNVRAQLYDCWIEQKKMQKKIPMENVAKIKKIRI